MQSMTLEQLRTASEAGGVSSVTLKGQGARFSFRSRRATVPALFWRKPAAPSRVVSEIRPPH